MKAFVRVLIIASLLLVSLRYGCPMIYRIWAGRALSPPNAAQLRDIEKLMLIEFPPSARPVAWTHHSAVGDWCIMLKLEISPTDLAPLIAKSPFTQECFSTNKLFYISAQEWWNQGNRATNYKFAKVSLPEHRVLEMLVDMDNADVYLVYLVLFGT